MTSNKDTSYTSSESYVANNLKFTGDYFAEWRTKMEAYLDDKELLDVVLKAVPGVDPEGRITEFKVKERDEEELIKKSKKAYNILIGALTIEQMQLVMHIKRPNAYRVWKTLVERYEPNTQVNKIML